MKALSIQQPYAHLIVTPAAELAAAHYAHPPKRVENRTRWPWKYFGPLLIHTGLSKRRVSIVDEILFPHLVYGAIVGQVELIAVRSSSQISIPNSLSVIYGDERIDLEWVRDHPHTEGPVCLIFRHARRFKEPIPWKGRLGLFEIPDAVLAGHELEEVA